MKKHTFEVFVEWFANLLVELEPEQRTRLKAYLEKYCDHCGKTKTTQCCRFSIQEIERKYKLI